MTDTLTMYRIVEARMMRKEALPESVLLPEKYENDGDGTYIDSVLDSFMDGIGASIDAWAIKNMFLSYGVSPKTTERAMQKLVGVYEPRPLGERT